jgi:hypothetical protein
MGCTLSKWLNLPPKGLFTMGALLPFNFLGNWSLQMKIFLWLLVNTAIIEDHTWVFCILSEDLLSFHTSIPNSFFIHSAIIKWESKKSPRRKLCLLHLQTVAKFENFCIDDVWKKLVNYVWRLNLCVHFGKGFLPNYEC